MVLFCSKMESFSLVAELDFCVYVPVYLPKDCHDLMSGKL